MSREMTVEEARELIGIRRGADIWGYTNARNLRLIQREVNPKYIQIVKAMDAPKDGKVRQPYFGAIATKEGLEAAINIIEQDADALIAKARGKK